VLNPDTRVAICCYQGDAPLVVDTLSLHQRHCCPITILSPENSPVLLPGLDCRAGGLAGHTGVHTLERQRRHLEILLELPENHFMIHDSDSICLDAKFPDYLYEEPEMVWSNQVNDDIPQHQATFPEGWPHVAFQPPYFLSRTTIERMLAAAPHVVTDPRLPNIDHYMVQLTYAAGLQWRGLEKAVGGHFTTNKAHLATGITAVERDGFIFIHGAKSHEAWKSLIAARRRAQ
jgi:hypothetical protein